MIPYFELPSFTIFGQITAYPFGVLAFLGFVFGLWCIRQRGLEAGESEGFILSTVCVGLAGALIGACGLGIGSAGMILGGAAGVFLFCFIARKSWRTSLDFLFQGALVGWIFVRLGCTLAHDHRGRPTSFFLAFDYPEGARHNLGFYEFLFTLFVLYPTLTAMRFRKPRFTEGTYFAMIALLYSPARLLLELLRDEPFPTSAQAGCVIFFVAGWVALVGSR